MAVVLREVAEALPVAAREAVSEVHLAAEGEEAPLEAPSEGEAVAEVLLEVADAATRRNLRVFEHRRGVYGIGIPGHMGTTRCEKGALYVTISRGQAEFENLEVPAGITCEKHAIRRLLHSTGNGSALLSKVRSQNLNTFLRGSSLHACMHTSMFAQAARSEADD